MIWSPAFAGDVPSGVVTVTSTVPALWAGVVTVMDVSEVIVPIVPGVPPKTARRIYEQLHKAGRG